LTCRTGCPLGRIHPPQGSAGSAPPSPEPLHPPVQGHGPVSSKTRAIRYIGQPVTEVADCTPAIYLIQSLEHLTCLPAGLNPPQQRSHCTQRRMKDRTRGFVLQPGGPNRYLAKFPVTLPKSACYPPEYVSDLSDFPHVCQIACDHCSLVSLLELNMSANVSGSDCKHSTRALPEVVQSWDGH
jgi:hypothetical protein